MESKLYKEIQPLEDVDLLSEEKEKEIIDKTSSGYPYGLKAFIEDFKSIRSLEMTRRLKNSIDGLSKTTSRHSKILIFLTIIMTIAVLIQVCYLFK